MNTSYIPHSLLPAASITASTATKLCDIPAGVVALSFPIGVDVWVHVRPTQLSDPSFADVQNYGIRYQSTDGFVQLEIAENSEVWVGTTASTTLYATLWGAK